MWKSVRGSFPETPSLDSGDIYKSMDGAGIPGHDGRRITLYRVPLHLSGGPADYRAYLSGPGPWHFCRDGLSCLPAGGRWKESSLCPSGPSPSGQNFPSFGARCLPSSGGRQVIDDKGKGAHHERYNGKNRRNDDFLHFVSPPLSWPVPIRLVSMARLPSLAIR